MRKPVTTAPKVASTGERVRGRAMVPPDAFRDGTIASPLDRLESRLVEAEQGIGPVEAADDRGLLLAGVALVAPVGPRPLAAAHPRSHDHPLLTQDRRLLGPLGEPAFGNRESLDIGVVEDAADLALPRHEADHGAIELFHVLGGENTGNCNA